MNKQVLYKNKCGIDLIDIEEFLKMPTDEVRGRRVIAFQENDFVASGVIEDSICGDESYRVMLNYTDHQLESLYYIFSLGSDYTKADPSLYEYEEYKNSIENAQLEYNAIKVLDFGFKYIAFIDELKIVIDAEDEPFERNTLNLLTYDDSIDYYSRAPVLAVQKTCKETEIQSMQHYPQSIINNGHFIELQSYTFFDSVQYFNYHFNIDYYLHGEKLAKLK